MCCICTSEKRRGRYWLVSAGCCNSQCPLNLHSGHWECSKSCCDRKALCSPGPEGCDVSFGFLPSVYLAITFILESPFALHFTGVNWKSTKVHWLTPKLHRCNWEQNLALCALPRVLSLKRYRVTLAKWQLKGNMKTICKYLKGAKIKEEAAWYHMFQEGF